MILPGIKQTQNRFVAQQSPAMRRYFEKYFGRLDRKFRRYARLPYPWERLPTWRILPSMLALRYRGQGGQRPLPRGFLRDIRWGQYCLYLFTRFQDDLFDGEPVPPISLYASNECFFEAHRVFSRHLPPQSWFWEEYWNSVRTTTQWVVEVDCLQQKLGTRPEDLLEGYARVAGILKVGSAAVCAMLGQKAAYRTVSVFLDEMTKAGQIPDDIDDLTEDLGRQRFNYMFAVMRSVRGHPLRTDGRQQPFLESVLFLAAREQALAQAKEHVQKASRVIGGLALPGMQKHLNECRRAIERAERSRSLARLMQRS